MKVWKTVEYWMYFPFFKLHSWGKRSAVRRRRFIQRLPEEKQAIIRRGRSYIAKIASTSAFSGMERMAPFLVVTR